jgi:poly [ADP-ribose] polymerase
VTSICLPFYHRSSLKGVTCVDTSMSDLLADVTFFGRTNMAYAFVIGPSGRLFMHPLLPTPSTVAEDPNYLQATALETTPQAQDVIKSMLRYNSTTTVSNPLYRNICTVRHS